jgi:DNA repair protein RadC
MKQTASHQLALYHQLTKSANLSEVELSYRSKVKPADRPKITHSRETFDILKDLYEPDKIEYIEQFLVLLLNRGNKVLGWVKISQGGITATVADDRLIFQAALLTNATSIIISHNHPSGNTTPSQADISLTHKIYAAGKILDIALLDHVIVTPDSYYSFADEGLLIQ